MRRHDLHERRLPHDHCGGHRQVIGEVPHERPHALAADFLVARQGEMHGDPQVPRLESWNCRQAGSDETFHVGGAAAVDAPVALDGDEGIAVPGLALDGHDVRMSREHDPAGYVGPDRRIEIRLSPRFVVDPAAFQPVSRQEVFHERDELEIAPLAGGIEPDEILQELPCRDVARWHAAPMSDAGAGS